MLKKILLILVVLFVVFLGVVALQPDNFRVVRSASIAAAPAAAFAHVNDMHQWQTWSPWAKLDPAAKISYEGPAAGTGAAFSWVGNSEVGEGRMTVTESRPDELVRFRLDFFKPMAGTSTAEFTFKPDGKQTVVTWSMEGKNNFLGKAVCLFMNMDKMVGGQFEQGLANLNTVTAAAAPK